MSIGGRSPNHSVGLLYRLGARRGWFGEKAAAVQEVQQDAFAAEAQVAGKMPHRDGFAAFTIPGCLLRQDIHFGLATEQRQLSW